MNEVKLRETSTGAATYCTIRTQAGQYCVIAGPTLQTIVVANWSTYKLIVAEAVSGSYLYSNTATAFPAIASGWYIVDFYLGSGAISDPLFATQLGYWDGTTFHIESVDIQTSLDTLVVGAWGTSTQANAIKTKTDFLPSVTAGAAGGLFIAGTNAATTVTGSFTTTFTGNLTGNVGGNVTGSVGSIAGVTFPTHFSVFAIDASGFVTFNNSSIPISGTVTLAASQPNYAPATSNQAIVLEAMLYGSAIRTAQLLVSGGASGTYVMGQTQYNNQPVWMAVAGNIRIWFDGTHWVISSTPGTTGADYWIQSGIIVGTFYDPTVHSFAPQGAASGTAVAIYDPLTATDAAGSALSTSSQVAGIPTAVWQDTTAGDFTVAGSIGKSLGGSFTALGTSVFTTTALANAPTGVGSIFPQASPVTVGASSLSATTFTLSSGVMRIGQAGQFNGNITAGLVGVGFIVLTLAAGVYTIKPTGATPLTISPVSGDTISASNVGTAVPGDVNITVTTTVVG